MSKINKVFVSGEKLTASDLNSIVSAHNALEDSSISNTILSNQSYVTSAQLSNQGYLTAHQNIKTINSTSLVGTGNISIQENVQGDWNVSDSNSTAYIKNKPTIPSISGLATETYVTNKVADLVNSAPATLDTLNELAAALGNDPNFATTVSNEIGTKVSKTELSNQSYITTTALSGQSYVTSTQLSNQGYLTSHQSLDDYVTKTVLSNQSYVTQTSLNSNSYAGYSYVYAAYSYILNQIGNIETILQSI